MSFFRSSPAPDDQPARGDTISPDVTTGHLHHLSPDQQAAYAAFRDILAGAHLYTPPGTTLAPSHDEPTLLCALFSLVISPLRAIRTYFCAPCRHRRFLRARRFDPQKAMKQFADAEAWRAKHTVDTLYASFPPDEFEASRRFYPRWTGRRDKACYVPALSPAPRPLTNQPPTPRRMASRCTSIALPPSQLHFRRSSLPSLPNAATNACEPSLLHHPFLPTTPHRHAPPSRTARADIPPPPCRAAPPAVQFARHASVALYETMTLFVLRLCSALPHRTAPTPISSVTTIIDFDQVSLSLLWSLRAHLQEASTLATANYPETLSTIAVVNTPSFFPTVWGWIKVRSSLPAFFTACSSAHVLRIRVSPLTCALARTALV